MPRQSKAIAPVLGLVALIPSVALATLSERDAVATAVCTLDSFNWAFNSLDQSPCLIGAYAQSACTGGDYVVGPLDPGYVYTGPTTSDAANPCRCSVPVWNLISACGACQNASANPWDKWHAGCSSTTNYYPEAIPAGTRFPAWAFLSVPSDFVWDPIRAKAAAGSPESLPVPSSSSTSSTVSSTSSKVTVTTTDTPPTASNSGNAPSTTGTTTKSGGSGGGGSVSGSVPVITTTGSSGVIITVTAPTPGSTGTGSGSNSGGGSNTGAIAGGVVGGVVGLALVAGLLFWLQKRRNRHEPVPTEPPTTPYNPPMTQQPPATGAGYSGSPYTPSPGQQPLYNPNDPTTYPYGSSPAPSQGQYYQAANPFQTPLPTPSGPPAGYGGPMAPNRGYTGTPEVQHSA